VGRDLQQRNESLEEKLKELQSSTDVTLKKTYQLLILMIKNAKNDLSTELHGNFEMAQLLDVPTNQISVLKAKINTVFGFPILMKPEFKGSYNTFNSAYFFDLREAIEEVSGEALPPITFKQLLLAALETVPDCRTSITERLMESVYVRGHELVAIPSDDWKKRPPEWDLFIDVAPSNVEVLLYEKQPEGFHVKAMASKSSKCLGVIVEALRKVAQNRVGIEIEKVLIEPGGKTLTEIRQVLEDEGNRQNGYVPLIAATLRTHWASAIEYNQPILEILKSKGWIREEKEGDSIPGLKVNPFVSLAYTEYLTEQEKREFETLGLSREGIVDSYSGWHRRELYEMSILIPYAISSDPSFPFSAGDRVNVNIRDNQVVIERQIQKGRKQRALK
jgi:hypothetical protein